jgi:hypothetical protein
MGPFASPLAGRAGRAYRRASARGRGHVMCEAVPRVPPGGLRGAKNAAPRLMESRLPGRESLAPSANREPRAMARPLPPGAGGGLQLCDQPRGRAPGRAGRARGAGASRACAAWRLRAARGRNLRAVARVRPCVGARGGGCSAAAGSRSGGARTRPRLPSAAWLEHALRSAQATAGDVPGSRWSGRDAPRAGRRGRGRRRCRGGLWPCTATAWGSAGELADALGSIFVLHVAAAGEVG